MIKYATGVRDARLRIVRDALDGGKLEILSADGERIVEIELERRSGAVIDGVLLFNGFPKHGMAIHKGRPSIGMLKDKYGTTVAHGLSVDTKNADIVLRHLDVEVDNVIKIERAEIRHS